MVRYPCQILLALSANFLAWMANLLKENYTWRYFQTVRSCFFVVVVITKVTRYLKCIVEKSLQRKEVSDAESRIHVCIVNDELESLNSVSAE